MHKKLIYNGNLITATGIIANGYVLIVGDKIAALGEGMMDVDSDVQLIDAKQQYISPGFMDIHVHGGGGADFMDGTTAAFLTVAETHVKYGTTSLSPTTLTSSLDNLFGILDAYALANQQNTKGAQFIGVHLEGPYFSLNQRGAQDPVYIRNPVPEEYEQILAYSDAIARWSAAPELAGAIEFGKYVRSKGKILALAHTDATYEEALLGFENGYTLATHFYSAMSSVTRKNAFRYAGTVEAGYLIDDMDVEIIADGIHVPSALLKLVVKIKGVNRIVLVTDAMRSAGMPEGESVLGNIDTGMKVLVEDGVAKLLDRTAFAGSVATADRLLRTMINEAGVSIEDAVRMLTINPARVTGLSQSKGSIEVGKDADIVLFNTAIQIAMTLVNGNILYERDAQ